jgi:Ser/Thr protein kinase RdoA (MazF antagonist)
MDRVLILPSNDNPKGKCEELITASRAFHASLKGFPEPDFLRFRSHPWAVGDRAAWEEASAEIDQVLSDIYNELLNMHQPVRTWRPQLVHGDLSGNVLFSDREPPVIIDFSPFWRCAEYAEAIAVWMVSRIVNKDLSSWD